MGTTCEVQTVWASLQVVRSAIRNGDFERARTAMDHLDTVSEIARPRLAAKIERDLNALAGELAAAEDGVRAC
jgi:hypothetical protein